MIVELVGPPLLFSPAGTWQFRRWMIAILVLLHIGIEVTMEEELVKVITPIDDTPGAKAGILLEVNCETDFVGKNESFQNLCADFAQSLLEDPNADLEARRTTAVAEVGENIVIQRFGIGGNALLAKRLCLLVQPCRAVLGVLLAGTAAQHLVKGGQA